MSDTNCPFCGAELDIKLQHLGGPDWPPYLCGNSKNSNYASKACLERQAHNKTKAELDVLKLKLQKMSDTPETDEASFDYDARAEYWVDAEFARKLERERDEYKRRWQDWERWAKQVVQYFRRVPLDTATVGMRNTLTRWMQEMKDAK